VKLPNSANAHIDRAKIVNYLLAPDHPEGAGKAEFFRRFGCSVDGWECLAEALLAHARSHPVASCSENAYGAKYRIEGPILCPDGRSPSIRTVWIIDRGEDAPRLVTAHPVQYIGA
jgi:hypothetical protein